jgi:GTP cyclohydrolase I
LKSHSAAKGGEIHEPSAKRWVEEAQRPAPEGRQQPPPTKATMKTTESPTITTASYEDLVREMIVRLGEDPSREGLVRTPERVHKAYDFLTKGYREDPEVLLKKALFTVTYDEMVIVKDIEMFSLCEHHMLPFFGKVHVAYIPNGKVIGLSKIPRLIELFSRRLQIQERLTTQIAETIQKVIEPQGVGVVIEARHLCMMMRGVEKQHSSAVTSSMLGCFRHEEETRTEFLSLIRNRANGV